MKKKRSRSFFLGWNTFQWYKSYGIAWISWKKQDFAPDPNPNEQNPFFLEKNKSCLAVGFLKNQSIWLKKTVFSKKVGKSHRLGESRKPGGFLFPENQAISSSGFNKFASRYSLHAHFIIIHADCGVHSIFRFSFLDT